MFEIELFICIKMDLVLNNLQRLICHKTLTTNERKILLCWWDQDLRLLSQFQYCLVFIGAGVIIWFNIPLIMTFRNFVKILILKPKTFLKNKPLSSWHPMGLKKGMLAIFNITKMLKYFLKTNFFVSFTIFSDI